MDFFDTKDDLFGDSTPLISIENDAYVILPNTAEFTDTVSTLTYADQSPDTNVIATINYTYNDIPVGGCNLEFYKSSVPAFRFSNNDTDVEIESAPPEGEMVASTAPSLDPQTEQTKIIYIDMKKVILGVLILVIIIAILLIAHTIIHNYSFSPRGQSSLRRRSRQKEVRAARREARRNSRKYYKRRRGKR